MILYRTYSISWLYSGLYLEMGGGGGFSCDIKGYRAVPNGKDAYPHPQMTRIHCRVFQYKKLEICSKSHEQYL